MAGDDAVLPALAASLAVVLTVYSVKKWIQKPPNQVPGPMGWPIIGHLPYLLPRKLPGFMKQMIDKYGPIFKLKLGYWDAIMITDYQLMKKAFNNPDFSFRPRIYLFELVSHGNHGIGSSYGEVWQEQRRFALRHLRDLGMGKSSMEPHIRQEALEMIESLKKTVGEPIDFQFNLNVAVTNIIWALAAGKRMAHDDPVFLNFMATQRRNMELGATMGIVGFIPWLKDLLPRSWLGVDLIENSLADIEKFFENVIKEHKETFNPDDLRDYTDHFIAEQKLQGEQSTFTDLQMVVTMGDFFVAGGETTSTTLRWAVLLISYFPEVQKKLQDEIDSVVGRERLPSLDDREKMPYIEAVIHEVQRFSDISSLGIMHATGPDVHFEGFDIPKNTMVMGYVGECHRSPKYWAKPNEFYPEHFLDEKGQLKKHIEGFLPFSIGRRQCIGENLARAELFIFIAYFFQTFNFTLCQNDPKPSLDVDSKSGIVRYPSPYKVIMELR